MTPRRAPRRAWLRTAQGAGRRPTGPRLAWARPAALAGSAALALAGCSVASTITTQGGYEPSDGVRADVGDVRGGNLLVVAAEDGGPGVVLGYLTNAGDEQAEVSLGPEGVEGGLTVVRVDGAPGAPTALELRVERGGSAVVEVPVLDGTLAEYAGVVPTPLTTDG